MSKEYDFQSLSDLPDDVVACRFAQGMDVCCGRCGTAWLQHLTDLGEDDYGCDAAGVL